MAHIIKVGICVAYDWMLLKTSLPRIYASADVICLGLDKNRKAWSGSPFEFNDKAFYNFVNELDVDKKIIVYEDDFAFPDLSTRQNCNRQRTLISQQLGNGGWHIQIDADEYFLDFKGFCNYLKKLNSNPTPDQKAINICCPFIPLIKKIHNGYLYINYNGKIPEIIPIATNKPDYQRARQNGHFNHVTKFVVIHDTWSRSEDELWYKINNWGHASEELQENAKRISYYNLWKSLDRYNYQYVRDLHPVLPHIWPALDFAEGDTVEAFLKNISLDLQVSSLKLMIMNSRNISRLKFYLKKPFSYASKSN
jgi:hypothetical protein